MKQLFTSSLFLSLVLLPSLSMAQQAPDAPSPLPPPDDPLPAEVALPPPAAPPPAAPPAPASVLPASPQPPAPPGYPGSGYPSDNQPGNYAPGYSYAPPPSPPPPPVRNVSLTVSPLHLFLPMLEVTGEVRVQDWMGLALIGGYGTMTLDTTTSSGDTVNAYEIGGQLAFYPLEPFESLVVGAELVWVKVDTDDYDNRSIRASAAGVAIGPMVGYKYIADGGFTLFVQGGFEYIAAEAEASDATTSDSAEDSAVIPLLNFNLGWSF